MRRKTRRNSKYKVYSQIKGGNLPFNYRKLLLNLKNLLNYEINVEENYTVQDIARKAGCSDSAIYYLLNLYEGKWGGKGYIQFPTVYAILTGMGILENVIDASALRRHNTAKKPQLRVINEKIA